MGCVNSKDINDTHSNVFQVFNVNDSGVTISPGKLQVTDYDLILYQRGKDPIRWPLKTLRKYGFDLDVFSFECGRRCATGEGIYAFRTRKAEQLFNLIQLKICGNSNNEHDNGPNLQDLRTCIPVGSLRLPSQVDGLPMGQSVTRCPDSRPGSQVGLPQLVSPSPPPSSDPRFEYNNNSRLPEPSYLNLNPLRTNLLEQRNYENVDVVVPTQAELQDLETEPSHVYMNITTPVTGPDSESNDAHCYVNINAKELEDCDLSVPSTPSVLPNCINYAALDLSASNTVANNPDLLPESPSKTKKGYATIDFQKTTALSQSINPTIETEEGSRKTRHNVTSRHSSSLSD